MKRNPWWTIPVAAFLGSIVGLLVQLSCSHVSPFERCVAEHAAVLSASRVQAAVNCNGQASCIEQSVSDDVQLFAAMSEQCRIDTDGGK